MSSSHSPVTVATLAAFSDAWNRHDIDALMSFMSDDCVFQTAAGAEACGTRHRRHGGGAQGLRRRLGKRCPTRSGATACTIVAGDFGTSEWTFTGTAADGSRIEANGVDLFTFKDGKIQRKNVFRKARPNLPAAGPSQGMTQHRHRAPRPLRPDLRPAGRAEPRRAASAYAPTYWVATAGTPPEDDGPVQQDIDVDVAIIGSGSTGLSTALYLAQEHGIRAVVLEANQAAWGCSSRSGGQGQNASGRLKRSQWIARWGLDVGEAARQRDPHRLRELPGPDARRSTATRIDGGHLLRGAPAGEAATVLRSEGAGDARGVRLRHAHAVGRGTAARLLRRARGRGRAARTRRHRHPSAEVQPSA